jgi:predicted Zn-dependent protease
LPIAPLRLTLLAALIAVLGLTACQSAQQTTRSSSVAVEREQLMSTLVDESEYRTEAALRYKRVIGAARRHALLDRDPTQLERAQQTMQRLTAQTGVFRDDAPRWSWEIHVITAERIGAWCLPGGKMAISSALFDRVKPNDDELAAVIGHEIAHALREHGREAKGRTMSSKIALFTALFFVMGPGLNYTVTNLVAGTPNLSDIEIEADLIGVELAAKAGYQARGALTFWQKMARLQDDRLSSLSSHPTSAERLLRLDNAVRTIQAQDDARAKHTAIANNDHAPVATGAARPTDTQVSVSE